MGVDACRQIESARCRAAEACGEIPDAESCERFYRDQCLHGFSVAEPTDREAEACARALDDVAECARADDDSGECADACNAVAAPESLGECAFLNEDENGDGNGEGGAPSDEPPDQSAGTAGTEAN